MVLENLKSAFDNIIDRFKSPFAGTFIVVWCLHHWILVFSLFNFDSNCTLPDKIAIISTYITTHSSCELLWLPILYTFAAIVVFYIFHLLALAISTAFTSLARPFIIQKIDNGSYVDRTAFIELKAQKDFFERDANTQFEKQNILAKEIEFLKQTIDEKSNQLVDQTQLKNQLIDLQKIAGAELERRNWQLNTILHGEWLNTYMPLEGNGKEDKETFSVGVDNVIYINNRLEFEVKEVYYNKEKGYLSFVKIEKGRQYRIPCVLLMYNEIHFEGIEYNKTKYKVVYTRIPQPISLDDFIDNQTQ